MQAFEGNRSQIFMRKGIDLTFNNKNNNLKGKRNFQQRKQCTKR